MRKEYNQYCYNPTLRNCRNYIYSQLRYHYIIRYEDIATWGTSKWHHKLVGYIFQNLVTRGILKFDEETRGYLPINLDIALLA